MISKLVLVIITVMSLPCSHGYAISSTTEKVVDFRQIAKEVIPAVVSIQVQTKSKNKKAPSAKNRWNGEDEGSTTDFWQRFFGIPFDDKSSSESRVGQASGFIVSSDGHVITNSHVIKDAEKIIVTLNDGEELIGKLVGEDSNTDIALLKVEAKNLPYLQFGNSDELEVAQWIMAIGTPYGLQATVTVGVVSAKGRNNLDLARIEDFIQTDTAINRGNSGGPLLDLNGKVIGVNTAIASTMGGSMGIGFAVPSNIAKNVLEQLMSKGSISRSYVGIELQQIDQSLAEAFGLSKPDGILVAQVVRNSPADKAGIQEGDIIMKYNGVQAHSIGSLRTSIALMVPGSKIKLALLRHGTPMNIEVETAEYLGDILEEKEVKENILGLFVSNLTPDFAKTLGYQDVKGVLITQVEQGSVGQLAGLRKGGLIMAVGQTRVETVDQFKEAIETADSSKPVLLLVKEGNSMRFVSVLK